MTDMTKSKGINGIDTEALMGFVEEVKGDSSKGIAGFNVSTEWKGSFLSETKVDGWSLGGERCPHSFSIDIDEPRELCGGDSQANPQEYLMAAMNACMLNTFVACCSLMEIRIDSLVIEAEGELDLRGFLGIDPSVPAGYEEVKYTIRVKGNGTPRQFEKAHEAMIATSPNYFNMTRGIPLRSEMIVE